MIDSLQIQSPSLFSRISLRRIVTSNRFIPEIDGFRFVAIVIVIFSHIYGQCGPIPGSGRVSRILAQCAASGPRGVYLFFTISGFILALPFARHHLQQGSAVNLRSYFRRRITRLEPPYMLAMVLRFPLLLLYKQLAIFSLFLHLLASLFYLHNLIFNHSSILIPPAWSLEVEVQFYLLAPLLTGVFCVRNKQLRRVILVACMVLAGVIATKLIPPGGRLSWSLLYFLQYFFAGFLLCDLYLTSDHFSVPFWLWDILGIFSIVWILLTQAAWYPVLIPFATIVLYMAGFHGRIVRAFFSFTPIPLIGGMCYSLYLTHSAVLSAMHPIATRLVHSSFPASIQASLIFGLCFTTVLIVGVIYFVLIERPCMDPSWPNKLAATWRNAAYELRKMRRLT
jgi:peptidoglycan/LPS O-acetylase OafA/YrhL